MCYFNKIAETNNGAIYFAECGRQLMLNYNNISVIQDYQNYIKFYDKIEQCYQSTRNNQSKDIRDITFKTLVQSMVLRFSTQEIEELHYLMQTALIEYNVHVQV